jgi:glutaredoxin 3
MRHVRVYTTNYCGYCTAAKRYLTDVKKVPFEEIDVSGDRAMRAWLVEASGGRTTVPQIFVGDTPIGGYDDLRALDARGGLDPLLAG